MKTYEVDQRVAHLVEVLNGIEGIYTFSSCGGHANPNEFQLPEGEFYVCFECDRWDALDVVVAAADDLKLDAQVTAWWNGSTCFELRGTCLPDALAREIVAVQGDAVA